MNEKDEIIKVIYVSMRELNYQLPQERKLIEALDTILVGEGGVLDSLGLITLLVNIEQALSKKCYLAVALVDVLMAEHEGEHPFHDVTALTNWVVQAQSDSRKAG